MVRTIACATQLGSISSLRCQKSRRRVPEGQRLRSDVFADDFFGWSGCRRSAHRRSAWRSLAGPWLRHAWPKAKRGGARRDRTDDLMLAKHALSQLSYGPVFPRRPVFALWASPDTPRLRPRGCATRSRRRSVVGLGRLELPTSRLSSARSNQLSYKPLTTKAL